MALPDDLPEEVMRMPASRKGIERKGAVADAALRIISQKGIHGLSMRSVAAEAHLPLGTASYYFQDKDELIEAAFRRHAQRETARVAQAVSRLSGELTPPDLAVRLAEFVTTGLTEHRAQLIAEYELLAESTRQEHLLGISAAWQEGLVAQLEAVTTALGSSRPKTDARLVLAVIAGLEVDHLAGPLEPAQARSIASVLQRLFEALGTLWQQGGQHADG